VCGPVNNVCEVNYLPCLSLLQEIQQKLGEFEAKQKKSLKRRLKEFATSTSVGHELARYRTRLKRLRSNFIVSTSPPISSSPHQCLKLTSMAQLNINSMLSSLP
jgi:hypothetical protein